MSPNASWIYKYQRVTDSDAPYFLKNFCGVSLNILKAERNGGRADREQGIVIDIHPANLRRNAHG